MLTETSGRVDIRSERDLLTCRRTTRAAASDMGFRLTDVTRLVTAASELARNVLRHSGGKGLMRWKRSEARGKNGLELAFEDEGPGIADVGRAMQEGFTTAPERSLGMGLPGTKRLVDEMEVDSVLGRGTTITIRKWLRRAGK